MATDPLVARATLLRESISRHNAQVAVQEALYKQFQDRCAVLGVTPETLDYERAVLQGQLEAKRESLEELMNLIAKEL